MLVVTSLSCFECGFVLCSCLNLCRLCCVFPPAFEVEVKCWYNQALPVGANVSVLCHTSLQGRPAICGLCQIDVMIFEQRHHLPSACTNISETHAISIAFEHKGHVRCTLNCLENTVDTCNVTVLGGSKYLEMWCNAIYPCNGLTVNAHDVPEVMSNIIIYRINFGLSGNW